MHSGEIGLTLSNPQLRRKIAAALAQRGAPGDSLLAHITPREAWLLRLLGGSGGVNPRTGLHQFTPIPGTPAAGTVPQPPQLGGYSLQPLMAENPGGNLIGNGYGSLPAWALQAFQLGLAPRFANPAWPFPTGGSFQAPGSPRAPAPLPAAAPTRTGNGFGTGYGAQRERPSGNR